MTFLHQREQNQKKKQNLDFVTGTWLPWFMNKENKTSKLVSPPGDKYDQTVAEIKQMFVTKRGKVKISSEEAIRAYKLLQELSYEDRTRFYREHSGDGDLVDMMESELPVELLTAPDFGYARNIDLSVTEKEFDSTMKEYTTAPSDLLLEKLDLLLSIMLQSTEGPAKVSAILGNYTEYIQAPAGAQAQKNEKYDPALAAVLMKYGFDGAVYNGTGTAGIGEGRETSLGRIIVSGALRGLGSKGKKLRLLNVFSGKASKDASIEHFKLGKFQRSWGGHYAGVQMGEKAELTRADVDHEKREVKAHINMLPIESMNILFDTLTFRTGTGSFTSVDLNFNWGYDEQKQEGNTIGPMMLNTAQLVLNNIRIVSEDPAGTVIYGIGRVAISDLQLNANYLYMSDQKLKNLQPVLVDAFSNYLPGMISTIVYSFMSTFNAFFTEPVPGSGKGLAEITKKLQGNNLDISLVTGNVSIHNIFDSSKGVIADTIEMSELNTSMKTKADDKSSIDFQAHAKDLKYTGSNFTEKLVHDVMSDKSKASQDARTKDETANGTSGKTAYNLDMTTDGLQKEGSAKELHISSTVKAEEGKDVASDMKLALAGITLPKMTITTNNFKITRPDLTYEAAKATFVNLTCDIAEVSYDYSQDILKAVHISKLKAEDVIVDALKIYVTEKTADPAARQYKVLIPEGKQANFKDFELQDMKISQQEQNGDYNITGSVLASSSSIPEGAQVFITNAITQDIGAFTTGKLQYTAIEGGDYTYSIQDIKATTSTRKDGNTMVDIETEGASVTGAYNAALKKNTMIVSLPVLKVPYIDMRSGGYHIHSIQDVVLTGVTAEASLNYVKDGKDDKLDSITVHSVVINELTGFGLKVDEVTETKAGTKVDPFIDLESGIQFSIQNILVSELDVKKDVKGDWGAKTNDNTEISAGKNDGSNKSVNVPGTLTAHVSKTLKTSLTSTTAGSIIFRGKDHGRSNVLSLNGVALGGMDLGKIKITDPKYVLETKGEATHLEGVKADVEITGFRPGSKKKKFQSINIISLKADYMAADGLHVESIKDGKTKVISDLPAGERAYIYNIDLKGFKYSSAGFDYRNATASTGAISIPSIKAKAGSDLSVKTGLEVGSLTFTGLEDGSFIVTAKNLQVTGADGEKGSTVKFGDYALDKVLDQYLPILGADEVGVTVTKSKEPDPVTKEYTYTSSFYVVNPVVNFTMLSSQPPKPGEKKWTNMEVHGKINGKLIIRQGEGDFTPQNYYEPRLAPAYIIESEDGKEISITDAKMLLSYASKDMTQEQKDALPADEESALRDYDESYDFSFLAHAKKGSYIKLSMFGETISIPIEHWMQDGLLPWDKDTDKGGGYIDLAAAVARIETLMEGKDKIINKKGEVEIVDRAKKSGTALTELDAEVEDGAYWLQILSVIDYNALILVPDAGSNVRRNSDGRELVYLPSFLDYQVNKPLTRPKSESEKSDTEKEMTDDIQRLLNTSMNFKFELNADIDFSDKYMMRVFRGHLGFLTDDQTSMKLNISGGLNQENDPKHPGKKKLGPEIAINNLEFDTFRFPIGGGHYSPDANAAITGTHFKAEKLDIKYDTLKMANVSLTPTTITIQGFQMQIRK